jgi:hypothetical protein
MTSLSQLAALRDQRNAAKAILDERIAGVRQDLAERSVAGRIADKASDTALDALDEAVAVVDAHPGIIAGTLAALAVWFLRNPIMSGIERLSALANDLYKDFKDE